ncbi:21423_t:CDS:2, partial [Racocetra persica]
LAELWNVTEDDVPELLNTESYLRSVDKHFLKPLLDNNEGIFGGSYIDVKKDKIIIRTLNLTGRNIILSSPQIRPYRRLLKFKLARYSLAYLKTMLTKIIDEGRKYKPRGITTYIERELNKVIVWTDYKADEHNQAFLNAIQSYNATIRYYGNSTRLPRKRSPNLTDTKRIITRQIMNGDGIINNSTRGICTSGFWVIDLNGNDYVVTAGHCGPLTPGEIYFTLSRNSSEPKDEIGPMVHNDLHGTDFGLIQNLIASTMHSIRGDSGSPVFYSQKTPFMSLQGIHVMADYSEKWGNIALTIKTKDIFEKSEIPIFLGDHYI